MNQRYFATPACIGILAVAVCFGTGCNKSSVPASQAARQATPQPASQPQPTDDQIASEVQNRLQTDSGLANMPIQVKTVRGVVTLSGAVNGEAARELAANDAAQVSGVRTVVNNLVAQTAMAAAAPSADAEKAARKSAERDKADQDKAEARTRRRQQEQARRRSEQQQQQSAAESQQAESGNLAPVPAGDNRQGPPAAESAQAQMQQAPPPPPPPPPQPITRTVTIPAGSDLAVRITENLATGQAQPNDSFHGVLANSLVINGQLAIRRGANVTGIVLDAKDATHFKGRSELSLGLEQIRTPNQVLTVSTDPVVRQGAARGKNTAMKSGGGALLGTLIGALAGGGRGAAIGAVAGAGAGAGANAVTRGEQVQIPSETVLHFTLSQPVNVRVTTMPGGQVNEQDNGGSPQLRQPQ
jgi:uncharacterized protein YcfJ